MSDITVRGWSPVYSQVVTRDGNISYGGGTRARLIYDSIWYTLNSALDTLGWFATGRRNKPVTFLAEQLNWDEEIELNTVAFIPENVNSDQWEVGSLMMEDRWVYYLDIFGEDEAISLQIAGDLRDILWGRMAAVGRVNGPTIDILDLSQPGHYKIGYVELSQISVTRAPTYTQRWQRYLRVIRFEVSDWYITDVDDLSVGRAHWAFTQ